MKIKFAKFCVKHTVLGFIATFLMYFLPISAIYYLLEIDFAAPYVFMGLFLALIAFGMVKTAPNIVMMPDIKHLNEECDPFPLLETAKELMGQIKGETNCLTAKMNYCVGLSAALGDYEKNLQTLEEIKIETYAGVLPLVKHVYYNNLSDAYLSVGNIDLAKLYHQKSEELLEKIKNKKQKETAAKSHVFATAQLYVYSGEYEKGLELLKNVDVTEKRTSVAVAMCAAKANIALGRPEIAKNSLEYVIAHGNRLYSVTKAKKLLEQTVVLDSCGQADAE